MNNNSGVSLNHLIQIIVTGSIIELYKRASLENWDFGTCCLLGRNLIGVGFTLQKKKEIREMADNKRGGGLES